MKLCLYVVEVLHTRRHRYVTHSLEMSLSAATHKKFELVREGKNVRVRRA